MKPSFLFISFLSLLIPELTFGQDSTMLGTIDYELAGPLVPANKTIVTAWDIPKNPLTDSTLGDSPLSREIRRGFRIFMNTGTEAPQFVKNKLSCNNCHLNGGQREKALPLVGTAGMFPEYNRRSGQMISLEQRIVGCFLRSENGAGEANVPGNAEPVHAHSTEGALPSATSPEVLAVASYVTWLSAGHPVGENPSWRNRNMIERDSLIPVDKLDGRRGEALFKEHCVNCHGEDGQGVQIGDKKPGPLWGPDSWNDGAGAARVYTLAGIIRYMMPYLEPGKLSDEEALQISAYINSKPRPEFPHKDQDYLTEPVPPDAVYYRR